MKEITFEAVYGIASIKGYIFEEKLNDEECIHYLEPDHPIFPRYKKDYAKLKEALDEDFMLLQFLHDFKDESATIDRGHYILNINGGRDIEVKVEPHDDKLFNTKITVNYGYSILSDELLELYGECLATSYYARGEYAYDKGENTVYIYIEPEIWKDDKYEIMDFMEIDADWVFTHQLVIDKKIYWTFFDLLQDYLLENDDPKAADTSFVRDCTDFYEQNMETCGLEYLNNLCFDEMVEDIMNYIEEYILEDSKDD